METDILTFIFYVADTCDIIMPRMKKFLTCFIALACFAPAAFAADTSGASSRVMSSSSDTGRATSARGDLATSAISRTTSRTTSDKNTNMRSGVTQTTTSTRNATAAARANAGIPVNNNRTGLDAAVNTVGRSTRTQAATAASNVAARRAGLVLRPSTTEVGGRAKISGTELQTGSNMASEIRNVTSRAATKTVSAESIAEAKERLEQTASLNKSCQEQYNDCMDQFCAVIDANQKRCSCSANLSKYTKVETAVKDANTQLNEVAQRIRYVGLSADEIRAIMTATEAEETLSGTTDTSETRSMLDEIEKLIKDPTSSSSYAADTSTGLDMDLDFSSEADIFNLDFLNTSTSSFSNLRGTELYNAAKKRCNTVLSQCKEVGATSQQITGNYDLAIDKDCIAYEQGLTKMNETLVSNVRSANRMLQKARLAVLQNKNQYDAKGCISALDACMTDDMVCGDDYAKCLDPTKTYIDENGSVVLGQDITKITDFMDGYNNADVNAETLADAYGTKVSVADCATDSNGKCVIKYLLQKIGIKQKVTDEGLCRAVLDKCQAYTYDANENYKPYNDIVVNYIQRAMVNIRAAQRQVISDYASSCMVDIASCYNQQVTQVNAWSSAASVSSVYNVMRGACRNVALTCAYAVFDGDPDSCPTDGTDTGNAKCINKISEMFYQSLLCPTNSTYYPDGGVAGVKGFVNDKCQCNDGYKVSSGQCVIATCTNGSYKAGACECNTGFEMGTDGTCVAKSAGSETDDSGTDDSGE